MQQEIGYATNANNTAKDDAKSVAMNDLSSYVNNNDLVMLPQTAQQSGQFLVIISP